MNPRHAAIRVFVIGLSAAALASPVLADPGHDRDRHDRQRQESPPPSYYPGPGGSRIPYTTSYYTNDRHGRVAYTYPQDYRSYGRPLSWYQSHSNWHDPNHQDWYRGRDH